MSNYVGVTAKIREGVFIVSKGFWEQIGIQRDFKETHYWKALGPKKTSYEFHIKKIGPPSRQCFICFFV